MLMVLQAAIFLCYFPLILLVPQFRGLAWAVQQDYGRADFPADFVFGAGSSAYQVC